MNASEAASMLKVTDAMLSKYVKQGRLGRYGPEERRHKFYKRSEVQAMVDADKAFFEAGDEHHLNVPSFFMQATVEDMPSIVDIDKRTFHVDITEETYLRWFRKNPEAFSVLKDATTKVIGYAVLLPMTLEAKDQFVQNKIGLDDISPEDIDLFEPGKLLHLYVIALCVDPNFKSSLKKAYGASLVRGLFTFILDLARRGVEIETITARSYKVDGIKLMRKMGIPQLRSPVPDKNLFEVRMADSGFQLFVDYSDLLEEWKQKHQKIEE